MSKVRQEIKLTEQRGGQEDYPPAYFMSIELEGVLCFKTCQKLDLCNSNGLPTQWTVILGNNGVGKTTLLRSLAGMEPTQDIQTTITGDKLLFSRPRWTTNS
jgi:ABC-type sugar transport system ATPase subunit